MVTNRRWRDMHPWRVFYTNDLHQWLIGEKSEFPGEIEDVEGLDGTVDRVAPSGTTYEHNLVQNIQMVLHWGLWFKQNSCFKILPNSQQLITIHTH